MSENRSSAGGVPNYVRLYESGELERRADEAIEGLERCRGCPRNCRVDRLRDEEGTCRTGRYARVSSCFPHFGEEDCLRGWGGSGTIFFTQCNLRCVFCQNYDISQQETGVEAGPEHLAAMMLRLQEQGCHNINFVTPSHVVPQILEALPQAVRAGLRLPIVYNTGAFDSAESLRRMAGIVDIYMPDFKYWDRERAERYLRSPAYPQTAREALREMHRQVGDLTLDKDGVARRGVLVRHLVMPGGLEDTGEIMRFLAAEISPHTYVNVMAQYHPAGEVVGEPYGEIRRSITPRELTEAYRLAGEAGLHRFDERRGISVR